MTQGCENLKEIPAPELQAMLDLKENPPQLIDVRQPQEYAEGHLPGALLFPLGQLELAKPLLDKQRPVVVYCRSGKRSLVAGEILCRLGLEQVFSLKGGIMGWRYELLTGLPQETLTPAEAKSVLDILLLAIGKELEARQVYTEELGRAKELGQGGHGAALVELLRNLAAREEAHMASIYERYLSWTEKQGLAQKPLAELQEEIMGQQKVIQGRELGELGERGEQGELGEQGEQGELGEQEKQQERGEQWGQGKQMEQRAQEEQRELWKQGEQRKHEERQEQWKRGEQQQQEQKEQQEQREQQELGQQQEQGTGPSFYHPFNRPEELLEFAVQQEFAAYDFYRLSAEQVKDPELRGLLFDLSFEERSHAASLLNFIPRLGR